MSSLLVLIHLLLQAGSVFVFPAIGLRALRLGGPVRLRVATVIAIGVIAVFAIVVAVQPPDIRPMWSLGRAETLLQALLLYGLTMGLPVLSGAGVVRLLGGRFASLFWPFAAAVIASGFGWVAGVILATWMVALT
jgi:hypothetical protein